MRQLSDFSDDRFKGACIHCGRGLGGDKTDREHIPTKSLLKKPYPENLQTVEVHPECNFQFSLDEEYLATLLASVLSVSTEPDQGRFSAAAGALRRSPRLRQRIDNAQRIQGSLWGGPEIQWIPEIERVNRVLVKNARGHAYYELGEPMLAEPSWVGVNPLSRLSARQRAEFERGIDDSVGSAWPEIGSRLMQRLVSGHVQPGGWIEVQPSVYRYAVAQESGGVLVRIVLREYLAAEVAWDESNTMSA